MPVLGAAFPAVAGPQEKTHHQLLTEVGNNPKMFDSLSLGQPRNESAFWRKQSMIHYLYQQPPHPHTSEGYVFLSRA